MESPEHAEEREQQELRVALDAILQTLRARAERFGHSEKGRATKIATTEVEKTSMVIIRSFFANEPYSPLQQLKKA